MTNGQCCAQCGQRFSDHSMVQLRVCARELEVADDEAMRRLKDLAERQRLEYQLRTK